MFYFEYDLSVDQQPTFKLKQSGVVEVESALIIQDLKDVETTLVVVDLFKYLLVSISVYIRSRTNLTL